MIKLKNIQFLKLLLMSFALLLLSSCANHHTSSLASDPYGFFSGVMHGLIFPFVLIGKIIAWFLSFNDIYILENVKFVGRPNTGILFYYFGYFLGVSMWGGASAK